MRRRYLSFLVPVLVVLACAGTAAQDDADDTRRLVELLKLAPGMTVAEIGAGDGDLTVAVARVVGSAGHVYSNELSSSSRDRIRAAVKRAGLDNVTIVEGRPYDTNLADGCCDAIFMRNVYHHFGDPPAMNQSLWRALKPGGSVAIIDFGPRGGREASTPADRGNDRAHGVLAPTVERELRAAGFEVVANSNEGGPRSFIVVGTRK